MVHGAENQPFRDPGGKAADSSLQGRKLPLGPIRVDDDLSGICLQPGANLLGTRSENNAREAHARMTRHMNEVLDEAAAAIGKQGFGFAHAARFTGSEDDGGEHSVNGGGWRSVVVQARDLSELDALLRHTGR